MYNLLCNILLYILEYIRYGCALTMTQTFYQFEITLHQNAPLLGKP